MTSTCRRSWCFWSGSPGRPEGEPAALPGHRLCCFLQQPRAQRTNQGTTNAAHVREAGSLDRGLGHAGVLGATAKVDIGCLDSCVWPGWTTESLSTQWDRGQGAGAWPSQDPWPQAVARPAHCARLAALLPAGLLGGHGTNLGRPTTAAACMCTGGQAPLQIRF